MDQDGIRLREMRDPGGNQIMVRMEKCGQPWWILVAFLAVRLNLLGRSGVVSLVPGRPAHALANDSACHPSHDPVSRWGLDDHSPEVGVVSRLSDMRHQPKYCDTPIVSDIIHFSIRSWSIHSFFSQLVTAQSKEVRHDDEAFVDCNGR